MKKEILAQHTEKGWEIVPEKTPDQRDPRTRPDIPSKAESEEYLGHPLFHYTKVQLIGAIESLQQRILDRVVYNAKYLEDLEQRFEDLGQSHNELLKQYEDLKEDREAVWEKYNTATDLYHLVSSYALGDLED